MKGTRDTTGFMTIHNGVKNSSASIIPQANGMIILNRGFDTYRKSSDKKMAESARKVAGIITIISIIKHYMIYLLFIKSTLFVSPGVRSNDIRL